MYIAQYSIFASVFVVECNCIEIRVRNLMYWKCPLPNNHLITSPNQLKFCIKNEVNT